MHTRAFPNLSDVSFCLPEKHFTLGDQPYSISLSSSSSSSFVCFHGSFLQNEIYLLNEFNRDSHLALRCRLFDGSAAILCVEDPVRSTDRQSNLRIGECSVRAALSRWNDGFICSIASSVESLDHRAHRSCVSFRFAC